MKPEKKISTGDTTRRKRIVLSVVITLAAVIAALAIAIISVPHAVINSNINQTSQLSESEVAVTPDLPPVHEVHNIALFGVDQQGGHVGRSDAMIILSIDRVNNKIKMTSLARDSLVPIDGHGEEKLTHAWAYGQAKLAVKTINQSFGMNITDYVYVNFEEFTDVIDYLGGVYVDVSAAEIQTMNLNHAYLKQLYGEDLPALSTPGVQLLNGGQALLYARNRTDGGDSTRTSRQREVLTAMYERVKTQPLSKLPTTIAKVLQLCHTNLTSSELLSIATWAITNDPTIDSLHMPNDQLQPWNGILGSKGWVRVYDLDAATTLLHNFIYETDTAIAGVSRYNPNTAKPVVATTAPTVTTAATTTAATTATTATAAGTTTTTTVSTVTASDASASATEGATTTTEAATAATTTSSPAVTESSATDPATSTSETTGQTDPE